MDQRKFQGCFYRIKADASGFDYASLGSSLIIFWTPNQALKQFRTLLQREVKVEFPKLDLPGCS